jgi:ankyrin repeat protein
MIRTTEDLEQIVWAGFTLLWYAANYGKAQQCIELIESGAKLDQEARKTSRLIEIGQVIWKGRSCDSHEYIFIQLIRAGANLDILDQLGYSAFDWVAYDQKTYNFGKALIIAGAKTWYKCENLKENLLLYSIDQC